MLPFTHFDVICGKLIKFEKINCLKICQNLTFLKKKNFFWLKTFVG